MKDNEIKEKIRKNIKEKIAISNIRKEFDMKTNTNKKIVYAISSICAVFILVIGIFLRTNNNLFQNNNLEIGKSEEFNKGNGESLNIELNINELENIIMASLDADIKTIETEKLPENFKFIESVIVPTEYQLESSYNIYVKNNMETDDYNILHDYVFNYRKDSINNIIIAFSEIEKPLRDYLIEGENKASKIGDVELIISQWKEMYVVTFEYKGLYFDIETTGITENQLVDLLESLINNVTNSIGT